MRKMKDSGIEWIGEIPEDWERTSLLNTLKCKISDGPHETPNLLENGIPFISVDSLNATENIDFSVVKKFISYEDYLKYSEKAKIEKGDILFSKAATIGKTAIVGDEKFMVWSPLAIIKPDLKKCFNKYIYFVLNCYDLIKYISLLGSNNTQINVGMRELEKAQIPIPPLPEQQKISAYLDSKCTEIDSVISKTKATIEEYKKLKQSVITQAVTKGIIPNRPMKDSGIEWIGEIPQEWKISKIKYVSDFQPICDTSHLNAESIITYTPMEYIKNGYYIENTAIFSSVSSSLTPYCEGDIVIAKVTPCFENGNIAIMNNLSSGFGMGSSELFVLRAKNIKKEFLFYWLQNQNFIKIACSTMTGTGGLKRVSPQFVRNSMLCLPSKNEQQEIANYLDEKCSEIDKLIAKKEQLLTEMENYKKAVIYEYVTGKKEV